jgi:hypothetical protein
VIGFLEQDVGNMEHFSPNPDEVKTVFTRPVSRLLDPTYLGYEMVTRPGFTEGMMIPRYGKSIEEGEEKIWGFTAWVLDNVLQNCVSLYLE